MKALGKRRSIENRKINIGSMAGILEGCEELCKEVVEVFETWVLLIYPATTEQMGRY